LLFLECTIDPAELNPIARLQKTETANVVTNLG